MIVNYADRLCYIDMRIKRCGITVVVCFSKFGPKKRLSSRVLTRPLACCFQKQAVRRGGKKICEIFANFDIFDTKKPRTLGGIFGGQARRVSLASTAFVGGLWHSVGAPQFEVDRPLHPSRSTQCACRWAEAGYRLGDGYGRG